MSQYPSFTKKINNVRPMIRSKKGLLENFDWLGMILFLVLLGISLFVLKSASSNVWAGQPLHYFFKELKFMIFGLVVFAAVVLFDYRRYKDWTRVLYIGTCVVLLLVLFVGTEDEYGVKRSLWGVQPSEPAKVILTLVYAAFLEKYRSQLQEPKFVLKSMLIVLIPLFLVFREPDLGTSLVFLVIMIVMLIVAGAHRKTMFCVCGFLLGCIIYIYILLYAQTAGFTQVLPDDVKGIPLSRYQLARLTIFINPYVDPYDTGYQYIQSEIAIGSGGLFGQGYGQGTQITGNFVPEHHTDFVFTAMAEEMGFVFTGFVLLLYMAFLLRLMQTAFMSRDLFGTLVTSGICAMFMFQILVNIGMTMGIMPVTGIPLPFFTYGGTSLLVYMFAVALVFAIRLRSPHNDLT